MKRNIIHIAVFLVIGLVGLQDAKAQSNIAQVLSQLPGPCHASQIEKKVNSYEYFGITKPYFKDGVLRSENYTYVISPSEGCAYLKETSAQGAELSTCAADLSWHCLTIISEKVFVRVPRQKILPKKWVFGNFQYYLETSPPKLNLGGFPVEKVIHAVSKNSTGHEIAFPESSYFYDKKMRLIGFIIYSDEGKSPSIESMYVTSALPLPFDAY